MVDALFEKLSQGPTIKDFKEKEKVQRKDKYLILNFSSNPSKSITDAAPA